MKKDFFEKFKKKSDKEKISMLILICLIFLFGYIIIGFLGGEKKEVETYKEAKETVNSDEVKKMEISEYEEQQRINLKNILNKINGVGDVDVMITFESDETKVPAMDTNKQTNTTEEKDKEGGERVTNQENDGSKVVITTSGNGNEPLILKTYKPKVVGVVVVAKGAEDSKTKYEISKAVSNLYNISSNKVNVYPMKK
ncbi:stage III sporulation protein AG [Clostridium fallax]|uniref:Stage III sporulation protein AG n=1 Tax=Clostridium fallax TaxID=1533 RepID=A0A1M4XMD1_9CLOT|nr:stage III sporulation protein AG [Clostridium fallax]SHE94744.1 stage III sporulation protein AG [Clostridium fallax]SQB06343.1 stage III sporulation protein AG [Clostridium fallax]